MEVLFVAIIVVIAIIISLAFTAGVSWGITEILDWASVFTDREWNICFAITLVFFLVFGGRLRERCNINVKSK